MSNSVTHGGTAPAVNLGSRSPGSPDPTPREQDQSAARYLAQSDASLVTDEMLDPSERAKHIFVSSLYDPTRKQTVLFYLRRDAPVEALRALRKRISDLSVPLSRNDTLEALTRCWALCKRRSETDDDTVLTMSAFLDKLKEYPADAVRKVLEDWPNQNRFTPTWAELKVDLDTLVYFRKRATKAIDVLLV